MDYLITYCSLNYTYDFFQKNHPVITTVVKKKEKNILYQLYAGHV